MYRPVTTDVWPPFYENNKKRQTKIKFYFMWPSATRRNSSYVSIRQIASKSFRFVTHLSINLLCCLILNMLCFAENEQLIGNNKTDVISLISYYKSGKHRQAAVYCSRAVGVHPCRRADERRQWRGRDGCFPWARHPVPRRALGQWRARCQRPRRAFAEERWRTPLMHVPITFYER